MKFVLMLTLVFATTVAKAEIHIPFGAIIEGVTRPRATPAPRPPAVTEPEPVDPEPAAVTEPGNDPEPLPVAPAPATPGHGIYTKTALSEAANKIKEWKFSPAMAKELEIFDGNKITKYLPTKPEELAAQINGLLDKEESDPEGAKKLIAEAILNKFIHDESEKLTAKALREKGLGGLKDVHKIEAFTLETLEELLGENHEALAMELLAKVMQLTTDEHDYKNRILGNLAIASPIANKLSGTNQSISTWFVVL